MVKKVIESNEPYLNFHTKEEIIKYIDSTITSLENLKDLMNGRLDDPKQILKCIETSKRYLGYAEDYCNGVTYKDSKFSHSKGYAPKTESAKSDADTNGITFDKFAKSLSVDDIDFSNKLNNLYESGDLAKEQLKKLDNKSIEQKVYKYIKSNISKYASDIKSAMNDLKKWYDEDDEEVTWGSALYNVDSIYLDAIRNVK